MISVPEHCSVVITQEQIDNFFLLKLMKGSVLLEMKVRFKKPHEKKNQHDNSWMMIYRYIDPFGVEQKVRVSYIRNNAIKFPVGFHYLKD